MGKLEQANCPSSPTNAHWWMIPSIGAEPIGRCQFCGKERRFQGSCSYDWVDYQKTAVRYHEFTKIIKIAE